MQRRAVRPQIENYTDAVNTRMWGTALQNPMCAEEGPTLHLATTVTDAAPMNDTHPTVRHPYNTGHRAGMNVSASPKLDLLDFCGEGRYRRQNHRRCQRREHRDSSPATV